MQELHESEFERTDCLECANCCKTTSPAIYERDIDRLAKHLKIKPHKLIEQYLVKDTDDDYVFKGAPCPFLDHEKDPSRWSHRIHARWRPPRDG